MSEEQKDRFVGKAAKGLGLLGINEPGAIVCCNNIRLDVRRLAPVAQDSLTQPEREELIAWIEHESSHASAWECKYLPPLPILKCTDLFDKHWGWGRLLAYDLRCEFEDPSSMSMYESYLEKFFDNNSHHHNGADAISECLEKEKTLSSKYKAKRGKFFRFNMRLSKGIEECMSNLLTDAGSQSRQPFSTYAAACIMKEAELMIEWLSQESCVPHNEYNTSHSIRQCALDLAMLEANFNTPTAAVLLGITKEVGILLNSVRSGCLFSEDITMYIRTHGANFLSNKFCELDGAELESNKGNIESVSFGKNEVQEHSDKNITDVRSRIVLFPISSLSE